VSSAKGRSGVDLKKKGHLLTFFFSTYIFLNLLNITWDREKAGTLSVN
jgi:hypothetical protein